MLMIIPQLTFAESAKIIFMNKCEEIDPIALALARVLPDRASSLAEVTRIFACHNITQAAKRAETREQVNRACRGRKCPIIFSVDPLRRDGGYEFGAWRVKKGIKFAAMPGCRNAERKLRGLVR